MTAPLTCLGLQNRLDEFLAGRLDDETRRAAERHLFGCRDCRALTRAARAAQDAPAEELAAGILARTSGAPCDAAADRLPDLVAGALAGVDEALMRGHVAHCPACADLLARVELVQDLLPTLASLDPGPEFTRAVLRETSAAEDGRVSARRPSGEPPRAASPGPILRLLARPRAALEGAFLVTAFASLLFAAPISPLAHVPGRALDLLREPPRPQLSASFLPDNLERLGPAVRERATAVVDTTVQVAGRVRTSLGRAADRLRELFRDLTSEGDPT